ncbi:MAG: hypothetical protein H7Y32_00300 [Chloroflexales bacterium]|nr:hypothetical protein [Chloroflexales bacterium]
MQAQPQPILRSPRARLVLTIAAIALGLAIIGFFGLRAVRSFRQMQYMRQQGLDRGTASVDAVRPWMTIRFVAVAYAVPEEYLYSALAIPFDRRNRDQSLGELNRIYQLGLVPNSSEFVIIEKARAAITEYRAHPVATGLRDVRPWMSVRYIANSSGVPEQQLFDVIGLASAGNENKPIDLLSDEQRYPGGPPALARALSDALAKLEGTP